MLITNATTAPDHLQSQRESFARILFCGLLCLATLTGCGERYRNEGGALGKAIDDHFVSKGLCKRDVRDFIVCDIPISWTYGHGNQVNFSIYALTDQRLVYALTGFVASQGLHITNGVPITLRFYPKPQESYLNHLNFEQPTMKLEITP